MPVKPYKVKDLLPGMLVDLENDEYADPNQDNTLFECEYMEVFEVEEETDDCIAVSFNGQNIIGFPPNHEVNVSVDN